MADDLSLLFRLKADNAQAKAVMASTRQEVAQLRQAFGPQLTQTLTVANKAFGDFGQNLNTLVVQRVPIIGGALSRLTEGLGEVATESTAAGVSIASLAGPIAIAVAAVAAEVAIVVTLTKEIFELTKASADYQGKLLDLSQQTGLAVETLSALEIVARTTGSSIEGLTQSLGIFQKKLEEAVEDRGSKAAVAFRELSVDARDTETALRQTIAALARMPEGFEQTALALEVFGRGGKAFLAIAKESNGNIDEITERLRGLGIVTTDQAKLADEFNDQLVLLQVQLRGLGTEAIPVVLDVLRDLSKLLKENRELFVILQNIIKAVAITIRAAFGIVRTELEKAGFVLRVTAALLERIAAAIGFINSHPLNLPTAGGAAAAEQQPSSVPTVDPFTEGIKDEIEARKRLQGVLNFEFAQRQQQAQDSIALAQRELEAGKRTRKELLDATIAGTRKQTQAQIDALQAERDIKLREAALEKDDLQKRDQIGNAILAIDVQIANKRSEQARNEADLRAKARLDERKAELAHEQARADSLIRLGQERIAKIEDLIRQEQVARSVGLDELEKIENASLAVRAEILKKELALVGVGPDRQAVLDKIKALEADRTALERQQSERRRQITREEFEEKRQLLISNLDALLQLEQIRGNAQIATVQAQAALRIKTEEQAAKEILAIRLRLLDSEIAATEAKQKAAAGIADPKERRQAEAQIANDLKILNAQRVALQEEGNREIDDARKKDIENERRYADELEDIQERIRRTEREAADEVIRLMRIHFASRKDLIRARLQRDIADEDERHRQAEETIRNLERENRESNKTEQEKLEFEKEINRLREAELRRHTLEEQAIKDQAKLEIAKPDAALRDVFDGIAESLTNLVGKFAELIGVGKEFAAISAQIASQIGGALAGAFDQFANALGQTVANWVLLGETGPAVMRKILAQQLASLAAEAAVQAVKQLALGFATLFFNPAESAAHFTAAALWGSIAGVAAVAGRGVAGDLFKRPDRQDRAGSTGTGQVNPITLGRNQPQTQVVRVENVIRVQSNDSHIVKVVTNDYRQGGDVRQVIVEDGGPSA